MGFSSLTELQGDLEITNNMNLENIESLSNLSSIGGDISITQNQKLSNCCSALDWETLTTGNVTIENNNAGCSDYNDVVDYCNGTINYSCEGNVVLNSQEDIDNFATNYDCTVIQGSLLINSTDVTNLDGAINITYTLNDGVTNGCGTATADLILTVNAAGDASGLSFDTFYCEGTDVTLPGTSSWMINGTMYTGGDVFSTTGLSAASPLQAVYTDGTGDCADSQTYLIVVESSSDVSLRDDGSCEQGTQLKRFFIVSGFPFRCGMLYLFQPCTEAL